MDVLPTSFAILKFCGAWTDGESTRFLYRALRFSYSCAITILIYQLTVFGLVELILTLDDADVAESTETLFMSITYVGLCVKLSNFIIRHKEFTELLDLLRSSVCRARDSEEKSIIAKYDGKAKWWTLNFYSMCLISGCLVVVAPLYSSKRSVHPLPIRVYLPYSIPNDLIYSATYVQQSLVMLYGISLNVSIDSLVYGFNLLVCGQMELLSYRLKKIFENADFEENGKAALRRHLCTCYCIKHHLLLYEIVDRVQSFFMWTVAIFFFFSLVVLCSSIFQLSKYPVLSMQFMMLLSYLMSVLLQIFCYCWFGNELELKSKSVADAAYFSNWTSATLRERRSLLIVMTISQKGLILSYYGIIVVAVHTFTWVTKTAYSAFNLLQQVSE